MNKLWYQISGFLIFLSGLIWIWENLVEVNILIGILGSIGIFVVFFLSAFYLINLNPKNYNKLTNSTVILILISVVWITLVSLYDFLIRSPNEELKGIITFIFGILPAGVLYGVSLIFLIINRFKNKK